MSTRLFREREKANDTNVNSAHSCSKEIFVGHYLKTSTQRSRYSPIEANSIPK